MSSPSLTHIDRFMSLFPGEGLTFDDVSLSPNFADFHPMEASVKTKFSRNIELTIPFVSAAMDTVTEAEMAIAMALSGGIGVIHRNMSIERQSEEVRKVKKYLNGLIENPVSFPLGIHISELLAEKERRRYNFSGFPIVDDRGVLRGIITAKDIKFLKDVNIPVEDGMTVKLITASEGTTLIEAFEIMIEKKVGKLPLIDKQGRLIGLYSFHDVKSLIQNNEPNINRDKFHKLRVAAAIGPTDNDRAAKLVNAGVDALVIDTSHGHTYDVLQMVRRLKSTHDNNVDLIAGNIVTMKAAQDLIEAGADALKVGIGPGSICTTRVVTGVGVPQLTAIHDVYRQIGNEVPIIADGGIKHSGDVPKALAVGGASVMMGSALAGTLESPGEKILHQGRTYVVYRGMGSVESMKKGNGSRDRYYHDSSDQPHKLVPQGVEGLVQYRGSLAEVLNQFVGGLKFAMGYSGAKNLVDLRSKANFTRVTFAGLKEAHPHGVKIIKDAPNYSSSE